MLPAGLIIEDLQERLESMDLEATAADEHKLRQHEAKKRRLYKWYCRSTCPEHTVEAHVAPSLKTSWYPEADQSKLA
jgi:hypothetical protein